MSDRPEKYSDGQVFEFPYPFTFAEVPDPGSEFNWKPGVTLVDGAENQTSVANGIGAQILTVVSTHKPGSFPQRIFYTRKWRDPDGKEFGTNKLHCRSQAHFTYLRRGYRHDVDRMIPRGGAA